MSLTGEDGRTSLPAKHYVAPKPFSRRIFTKLAAASLGAFVAPRGLAMLSDLPNGFSQAYQAFALDSAAGTVRWSRLSGAHRYETAAAIYRLSTELLGQFDSIILATGANFPDALAASGLAGICRAPLLLIPGATITAADLDEIRRVSPQSVYLVGGYEAISEEVEDRIATSCGVEGLHRLAGADRQETALAVYQAGLDESAATSTWGDMAIVATGANFPDALSAAPLAFAAKAPTFLTNSFGELSEAAYAALENGAFTKLLIVGGYSMVSSAIDERLGALGFAVERAYGEDRYRTSVAIADFAIERGYLDCMYPCIATGTNFPDALAGGVLAGLNGSVLLLANETRTAPLLSLLDAQYNQGQLTSGYLLGGLQAVNPYIESIIRRISNDGVSIILPQSTEGYSATTIRPAQAVVDGINALKLSPRAPLSSALESLIDQVHANIIYEQMSNFEKLRAIYEYLIINFEYGYLSTSSYDRESRAFAALAQNTGTCYEYASALCTMARQIGFPLFMVEGTTEMASGGYGQHYWNEIDIGGRTYILDANVDDSIASDKGCIWYYCFCRTYDDIPDQYRGARRIG